MKAGNLAILRILLRHVVNRAHHFSKRHTILWTLLFIASLVPGGRRIADRLAVMIMAEQAGE